MRYFPCPGPALCNLLPRYPTSPLSQPLSGT